MWAKQLITLSWFVLIVMAIVVFSGNKPPSYTTTVETLQLENLTVFPQSPDDGTIAYVQGELYIYIAYDMQWKEFYLD